MAEITGTRGAHRRVRRSMAHRFAGYLLRYLAHVLNVTEGGLAWCQRVIEDEETRVNGS